MAALPQKNRTKCVDGGNLGLIHQYGLTSQVPVVRAQGQTASQFLGDTPSKLRGRSLGIGYDQKAVDINSIPVHAVQQPLYQHPGLTRPGGGGYQQLSALVVYDLLLFLCQRKGHNATAPLFPGDPVVPPLFVSRLRQFLTRLAQRSQP